jgi:hypothetical protein
MSSLMSGSVKKILTINLREDKGKKKNKNQKATSEASIIPSRAWSEVGCR